MKIQKLLVLGMLGAATMTVANAPVFAKNGAHKVAKANPLGLSAEQEAQLGPIHKATKAQLKAIKADTTLSKKERHAKIKAVRADELARENAILTPAQQQLRDELKAKKHADKKAATA